MVVTGCIKNPYTKQAANLGHITALILSVT